jgi:hypothetical protein
VADASLRLERCSPPRFPMTSSIADRLRLEFPTKISGQQYRRNLWVLLVYFPAIVLMRHDGGRGIKMNERSRWLCVGSHHDVKSSRPKFLGSHFEMVANAENSWLSSHGHLQQRGMTFWLTLWGNRQSNDSIIAGAAFPTTRKSRPVRRQAIASGGCGDRKRNHHGGADFEQDW